MADVGERGNAGKGITGAIERAKKHPVVIMVGTFGAVLAFVLAMTDQFARIGNMYSQWRNPNATEYAALESLDLDSRPEFFEDTFGRAKKSLDVCREIACTQPAPDSLRMYIHESEGITVRAIFEGNTLEMYAVTLMNETLSPPITWLGYDLGELGKVTFAEAVGVVESVEPTDAAVFVGPQSSAYAEVVATGAPGRYRGLLLAWAPDGYGAGDLTFDVDAAHELTEMEIQERPYDPAVLTRFRSATTPNTYGEFRDDGGYVGQLVHDARELITLLYVGTEL